VVEIMSIKSAYLALSDFNLWVKLQLEEDLFIADIPALIPYKIRYIVDRWEYLRPQYIDKLESYPNPDTLLKQITEFDNYAINKRLSLSQAVDGNELLASFYAIFDIIPIADSENTKQEQILIEREINRITNLSKRDYQRMQKDLLGGRDLIFDQTGLPNQTYNRVYHRSSGSQTFDPNLRDYGSAHQFHFAGMAIDEILANIDYNSSEAIMDPFAFARNNLNNPDIELTSYASGNIARLNYGETLQQFSLRTLGSTDKWMEIAIANGLKPPYIDNNGTTIHLLSNASGSYITVAKTDNLGKKNIDKLYVGQIIFIQSSVKKVPNQRTIKNIREVPVSGDLVVELSGAGDLDQYKTKDLANIKVFAPNTANHLFYIVVPSNEDLGDANIARKDLPWFLRDLGQDEVRTKVDLRINSDGDLVFQDDGDIQIAYGIDNAFQAVKLIVSTELGSISRHRDFGIPVKIGESTANAANAIDEIESNILQQIENDSRFGEVRSINVRLDTTSAPSFIVDIEATLAGSDTPIPLTYIISANV
jgi:hypothetical protein